MCVCYTECLDIVCAVGTLNPYAVHNFKRSSFEVGGVYVRVYQLLSSY